MLPLGHVGVGYLLLTLDSEFRLDRTPPRASALVLVGASILPDLIDKPLAWGLGVLPTGRTLMHSLLVLAPLSVMIFALARRIDREAAGVAFGIGALSHPLLDALPVLWDGEASGAFLFWPVLSVTPYEEPLPPVLELLVMGLTDPYFLVELGCFALAVVLWTRHRERSPDA